MTDNTLQANHLLNAAVAVKKIQDNFLTIKKEAPWLTHYINRNGVTIQSLIEQDTFGNLSDFNAQNPAPSVIKQVQILKAFLNNEARYETYDIKSITQPLGTFVQNLAQQQKNLEDIFQSAQYRKEESWSTILSFSITTQLRALNIIQILNQMEHMLNSIENENQEKKELKGWVQTQRTRIANDPYSVVNHHPNGSTDHHHNGSTKIPSKML